MEVLFRVSSASFLISGGVPVFLTAYRLQAGSQSQATQLVIRNRRCVKEWDVYRKRSTSYVLVSHFSYQSANQSIIHFPFIPALYINMPQAAEKRSHASHTWKLVFREDFLREAFLQGSLSWGKPFFREAFHSFFREASFQGSLSSGKPCVGEAFPNQNLASSVAQGSCAHHTIYQLPNFLPMHLWWLRKDLRYWLGYVSVYYASLWKPIKKRRAWNWPESDCGANREGRVRKTRARVKSESLALYFPRNHLWMMLSQPITFFPHASTSSFLGRRSRSKHGHRWFSTNFSISLTNRAPTRNPFIRGLRASGCILCSPNYCSLKKKRRERRETMVAANGGRVSKWP